ncbi:MAG: flippase-like domain-containing protein [Ignavibacteriales bacterium]|nr:flippase-like domain-containing protein [Ignavibacteriales bacterium]
MTSDKENKNRISKVAGFVVTLFLTLLFLIIAFRNVDLKKALQIISETKISEVILYLIVFFASHYARAIRWKYMLVSIKDDVSKNHLFGSVMVSYGVSCVVPRLGEIYRALFLGKWENISRTTVLGTIVIERIIDITFFAFAALISVSLYSGDLYSQIPWLKSSLILGFGLIFFAILFLLVLIQNKSHFRNWLVAMSAKISAKLSEKLKELFDTLIEGFSSIKNSKHILAIIFWSVTIMLLYALNSYVGFFMLNMHNSAEINFASAWIVMTISSFGMLIPTPGGTGSYHAISILVLSQVFHFSFDVSAAYAILTHFISYVAFIVSSILIIYFFNRNRVKQGLPKETFISVLKN